MQPARRGRVREALEDGPLGPAGLERCRLRKAEAAELVTAGFVVLEVEDLELTPRGREELEALRDPGGPEAPWTPNDVHVDTRGRS